MERRRTLNVQCRLDPRDLYILAEYARSVGIPFEMRISSITRFVLEILAESVQHGRNIERPATYTEAMERLDALGVPLTQVKYNKAAKKDLVLDSERQTLGEMLPKDLSAPVDNGEEPSGDSHEDAAAALLRRMGHGR